MSCVEASAPGKLLLIGEYAVLDGAPALVMAVDRRVDVRIESAVDRQGWLNAPQLGIRRAAMRVEAGRLQCDGVDADVLGVTGKLIPAILRALGRAPEDIQATNIEINSGALFEVVAGRPVKLGLGSSAAVCAALAVGLDGWFAGSGDGARTGNRLERWLPVYREALGARASGADLAAAFRGGFRQFRSTGEAVDCSPVTWPKELYWRAVWTRQAAQTTDFVGAFDAWKQSDPAGAAGILAGLNEITRHACASVGDGAELFEACRGYADQIGVLGEAMGTEILTRAHRRLAEFARQCGVVYKSCGAGGGDLGIVLALDPDRLRAFESGISDRDGVPLNLAISDSGAGPRAAPNAWVGQ